MRIAELVGPPGAGKSTVYELLRHDDRIVTKPILSRPPYRGLLARHAARAVATLLRNRALGGFNRELLGMMADVRALPSALNTAGDGKTVLFDQGPIFTLTRSSFRQERLGRWWEESVEIWHSLLDAVIWLDAPDSVLLDRIDTRSKDHRLKGGARSQALATVAGERAVYEAAIGRFAGGPQILRFDTSRKSAEEIAAEVRPVICPP